MPSSDYDTIEKAIAFIRERFQHQPSLDDIAAHVHLSPYHFQRKFQQWAGISPKKFLQHISLNYAKYLLREKKWTLFDTTLETGLSGTGRLHDLFVQIEGMTPAEYKNDGEGLRIYYNFYDTRFGKIILASTEKGICYLHFIAEETTGFAQLRAHFLKAEFIRKHDQKHENVLTFFNQWRHSVKINLHVKGSPFQLKVWESLLQIPEGNLTTYRQIAATLDKPGASRAIGTCIGQNPVAVIIPCQRVIRSDGHPGGYAWGLDRKAALIALEQL